MALSFSDKPLRENGPALAAIVLAIGILCAAAYYGGLLERINLSGKPTEKQKLEILETLSKNSPVPPSTTDQKKIIDALSKQSQGFEYSEEGKFQILRDLEKQRN